MRGSDTRGRRGARRRSGGPPPMRCDPRVEGHGHTASFGASPAASRYQDARPPRVPDGHDHPRAERDVAKTQDPHRHAGKNRWRSYRDTNEHIPGNGQVQPPSAGSPREHEQKIADTEAPRDDVLELEVLRNLHRIDAHATAPLSERAAVRTDWTGALRPTE